MGDLAGVLKNPTIFLLARNRQKGLISWSSKCCGSWVLNLYLIIKKCLHGKKGAIFSCGVFGWFVGDLGDLLVVCGWFGWIVGGLNGLWVASSFTANASVAHLQTAASGR